MSVPTIPVCLTIAGSDSGGGAGIQTDLRTFNFFNTYGASAITCITAQNPQAVTGIHPVPAEDVVKQIRAVCAAYDVAAVKTGMLFSVEIIHAVADAMTAIGAPLVVDPVMVATSGAKLLQDDAITAIRERIIPAAALITPNLPEARVLLGREAAAAGDAVSLATELRDLAGAVLVKGGHSEDGRPGLDCLATPDGLYTLQAAELDCVCSHGTGCTLSAAIAANLALGKPLLAAVTAAKAFVWQSLANPRQLGDGINGLYPPEVLDESVVTVQRADCQ